ncbi:phage head morphogenesis protein [Acinetobacter larvae]|uniref:Phage head morphogenesis protein n=2 Tax=Acinetobacter larvae TaxID=1789224 RepID=A0A1B2M428_9GAMM|nr:phage head morphogenesis protein [Acinetobacter larvae]
MQEDVRITLLKEFKDSARREKIAMDGISDWAAHVIDLLVDRWTRKLDLLGPKIAELFLNKSLVNYDVQFKRHLRSAGFTVRIQLSLMQEEALKAVLAENIGLIKSIGTQYLANVQTHVWQCVTSGYDLGTLSKNLQKDFGVSERRAAFIARDQGAKAHAVIEQARRKELGITEAIWLHSHAGKKPRPSHLAAHGKAFDISKGMYLDGKWVLPGQEINCRCGSKAIIEGIVG